MMYTHHVNKERETDTKGMRSHASANCLPYIPLYTHNYSHWINFLQFPVAYHGAHSESNSVQKYVGHRRTAIDIVLWLLG